MRYLGIDLGSKRVGVATAEQGNGFGVAMPYGAIRRTSDRQVMKELCALAIEYGTDAMIVGEPRRLDGSVGSAAERARSFARKLSKASGLPVRMADEALTSVEAERMLREAGVDPRRHPERVDAVAAQLLLQQALDDEAGR